MNLEQLASLGEMIGGIAVVLTLMYLAYETRRNTTMHVASTTSEAYAKWSEWNERTAATPELIALWTRVWDDESLADFSEGERLQIILSLRSLTQLLAAIHQQHQKKLIDDEFWKIHKDYFAAFFQVRCIREWWEIERGSSLFTSRFIQEVDEAQGFSLGLGGQRVDKEST